MNESDRSNRLPSWQGHGPESVEERRRILRSLGAGGAIAGLPSLAHATGRPHCKRDGKNYNPTASAVGSMVGSVNPTTLPMYGNPCSHYQSSANWGTWTNGKGTTLTWNVCGNNTYAGADRLRFWQAIGFSAAPGTATDVRRRWCSDVIQNYPSSDEAIWLTALFNANKIGLSRFPYAPADVCDLYFNKNPLQGLAVDATLHGKALMLFRDYLSLGMPA